MPDTPLVNNPDDPKDMVQPAEPVDDPIVNYSYSIPILISAVLLIGTLLWAMYDEALGRRPWKAFQNEFVKLYGQYLDKVKPVQEKNEATIRQSAEYKAIDARLQAAEAAVAGELANIEKRLSEIAEDLAVITEPFQLARSEVAALVYQAENTHSPSGKKDVEEDLEELKQGPFEVELPARPGRPAEELKLTYDEIVARFEELKREQGELVSRNGALRRAPTEIRQEREDYVARQLEGLTPEQLAGLQNKLQTFSTEIKQINVPDVGLVERCESCHLGTREPLALTKADMGGHGEYVSHPNKELLQIHDPERFGCTSCHNGNGIATTSVTKAHGKYKHWLWPMYDKPNTEAGCQQCHQRDAVLDHSTVLDQGKHLFLHQGCWGCHARENFDPEPAQIVAAQKSIQALQDKKDANLREAQQIERQADRASDNATARLLYQRSENLRVSGSHLDAQAEQVSLQLKSLLQQQKKAGPTLKEMRNKLRKEWVPLWVQNPHNFRPTTKMPRFRLDPDEVQAISAFLWQSAVQGQPLATQEPGDPVRGKESFETRGCMACHSMGEGGDMLGGDFAANLTRVGEKVNYDYLVRWVHNPRERTLPYCPKEKRDITPEDYARHNLPFLFDQDHSRCPNDGAEMVVQQMTIMPSLRLTWQEARDIASYLKQQTKPMNYPAADFMDDPKLKDKGKALVRNYGCAGCHEIAGMEDEQRIGTELTLEGSKPIERLDFALLTEPAAAEGWYNHKGFFERKLSDPAVFDKGKIKSKSERLKMPRFELNKDEINALTTFLLGSVDSTIPRQFRYSPEDQRRDAQEGWWIVQKYNCMGCHMLRPGQKTPLSLLPQYSEAKESLPPSLLSEGARVDPQWLMRFLKDPSLTESGLAQAHSPEPSPSEQARDRNGIRSYLKVRMPTFYFTPDELRKLVKFFEAVSKQAQPYIRQPLEPLTEAEQTMARQLFNSTAAPCLKCHATGNPTHDATANAPNFLFVKERLKPGWTHRWLLDPQIISPGTAMPSGLFRREGNRWVFAGPVPESFNNYPGDHAQLLVRYMFFLTAEEQARSR